MYTQLSVAKQYLVKFVSCVLFMNTSSNAVEDDSVSCVVYVDGGAHSGEHVAREGKFECW